jgi:hypothetical protein
MGDDEGSGQETRETRRVEREDTDIRFFLCFLIRRDLGLEDIMMADDKSGWKLEKGERERPERNKTRIKVEEIRTTQCSQVLLAYNSPNLLFCHRDLLEVSSTDIPRTHYIRQAF